ncbi:MAG: hypothetical protein AABX84_00435 [Nanoarchaeota archaeon]
MSKLHLYEVVGIFDNPIFPEGRNIISYSANGFEKVYEAAQKAGLKKIIKCARWNLADEPEQARIFDFKTGRQLN